MSSDLSPLSDSQVAGESGSGATIDSAVGAAGAGPLPDAAGGAATLGGSVMEAISKLEAALAQLSTAVDQLRQALGMPGAAPGAGPTGADATLSPTSIDASVIPTDNPGLDQAAAGAQLANDSQLIENVLQTMSQSASGAQIATQLRGSDVTIVLATDEEMNGKYGEGVMGYYDLQADTVVLRRRHALEDPKFAAYILAHEGTHALDDLQGRELQFYNDAVKAAQLTQNPQAALEQAQFEQKIIAEAGAFQIGAMVAKDLGVPPLTDDPAIGTNGEIRSYRDVFNALLSHDVYNPEGRTATAQRWGGIAA